MRRHIFPLFLVFSALQLQTQHKHCLRDGRIKKESGCTQLQARQAQENSKETNMTNTRLEMPVQLM